MAKRKLKRKVKKHIEIIILGFLLVILVLVGIEAFKYYKIDSQQLVPVNQKKEYYNISDFGFARLKSDTDYNNNGKDDYLDFLEAAKKYAVFNSKYISDYYTEGYPPIEKEGIAADLTWYALKNAGYNLRDMIDKDIRNTRKKRTYNIDILDSNIDFRRIYNQETFFERYAKQLTNDIYEIGQFMPGDILIFDDDNHIAMVSDKYTENAVPYIIHHKDDKQKQREENILEDTEMEITRHYRFEYNDKIKKLIND